MNKLIAVGATAIMGMTSLGMTQMVTHAAEKDASSVPYTSMIKNLSQAKLGAVETQNITAASVKKEAIYIVSDDYSYISTDQGKLEFWKASNAKPFAIITIVKSDGTKIENIDPTSVTDTGKWVLDTNDLVAGDTVILEAKQGLKDYKTPACSIGSVKAGDTLTLKVNSDGTMSNLTDKQPDQQGTGNDVKVTYDYTAPTPSEPGWYGVIPTAITLTDTAKEVVADVSLVNANDVTHKTAYTGDKQVDVKVKSDNSYKLQDANVTGEEISYTLNKTDGTALASNSTEQELGTLSKATTKLDSKAKLMGQATKSGKYIDTLHYHFVEK